MNAQKTTGLCACIVILVSYSLGLVLSGQCDRLGLGLCLHELCLCLSLRQVSNMPRCLVSFSSSKLAENI